MRIGIDLGGTKIEAAALDRHGQVAITRRVATPAGDYAATVEGIKRLVAEIETALGRRCTVGVGMPGSLSPSTGLVRNANSTWLIGRRFDRDLAAALGRPVRFANDANCFALSEAIDGAAAGASPVFGVILGTGVGGGIVIDRRLLTGANAIAGEWGHSPLPWPDDGERPGPRCYCGKAGCIETFLSGPGLALDHRRTSGETLDAAAIAARADSGDAAAAASLGRYEDRLARGLAAVINLLDPEVIVLGGGLSRIDRLYRRVPLLWGAYVFSDAVTTRLVPPRHGDAGGVRGAAWLWDPEEAP
ncbi:MAG: ROK family protein [Stellaceae bacterium]